MNNKLLNLVLLLWVTFSIVAFCKSSKVKTAINSNTTKTLSKTIDGVYKFTGKLNGKIPVFLWFVVKNNVLKGEVTYLTSAKHLPITIIGTLKDEGVTIDEFIKEGYISGIYKAKFDAKKFTGTWYAPGTKKEFKYILLNKDTLLTHIDTALKPVAISGEYSYHFGEDGYSGSMDIKKTDPGSFLINISCVTAPPAYNMANVDLLRVRMVNNTIVFKVPGTDCKFKIRVFKSFIAIDMLSTDLSKCEFGNGATIEGVFIKTNEMAKLK